MTSEKQPVCQRPTVTLVALFTSVMVVSGNASSKLSDAAGKLFVLDGNTILASSTGKGDAEAYYVVENEILTDNTWNTLQLSGNLLDANVDEDFSFDTNGKFRSAVYGESMVGEENGSKEKSSSQKLHFISDDAPNNEASKPQRPTPGVDLPWNNSVKLADQFLTGGTKGKLNQEVVNHEQAGKSVKGDWITYEEQQNSALDDAYFSLRSYFYGAPYDYNGVDEGKEEKPRNYEEDVDSTDSTNQTETTSTGANVMLSTRQPRSIMSTNSIADKAEKFDDKGATQQSNGIAKDDFDDGSDRDAFNADQYDFDNDEDDLIHDGSSAYSEFNLTENDNENSLFDTSHLSEGMLDLMQLDFGDVKDPAGVVEEIFQERSDRGKQSLRGREKQGKRERRLERDHQRRHWPNKSLQQAESQQRRMPTSRLLKMNQRMSSWVVDSSDGRSK